MKSRFLEATLRLLAWLPMGAQRALGTFVGRWLARKNGRSAAVTRRNLQLCLPQLEGEALDALVRQSLEATATTALETAAVWFRGERWRDRVILEIENRELFDAALKSDEGLLLLIPHFGNWELAGIWASRFAPTTAIYRKPRMESMDGMLRRVRDIGGTTLVPANSRGVMAVMKALRRGEMSVILPDQEPSREGGIFSPFFGKQALTMTLVHGLTVKTGAKLLVAYARREPGGLVLGFMEPDPAVYERDQQEAVDGLNRSVEALVSMAPEQYQWEYKRFRRQPEGADPVYTNKA